MDQDAVALARLILSVRDDRRTYFDPQLFDEQAWELLLMLFVSADDGALIDRDGLLERQIASPASLDRWIELLTTRGILTNNGAQGGIGLTNDALRRMNDLLLAKARAVAR